MTAPVQPRRGSRALLLFLSVVLSFGFVIGIGASAAQAQAATPEQEACPISQFIESDGTTVDITSYAACVDAFHASQAGLARTGSDVGQYVGIGSALIALGAAFIWTSRRSRHSAQI